MSLLQIKEENGMKNEDLCVYSTQLFTCATKYLKKYSCKICDYTTHLKVHFAKHKHGLEKKEIVENTEKYSCRRCHNFHTYSYLLLARHENVKCPTEDQNETQKIESSAHCFYQNREFHCDHTYATRSKPYFKRHLNSKHLRPDRIKRFNCDHCDFKTGWSSNLKRHQELCHCPRENMVFLKCKLCSFKTHFQLYLNRHIKRHARSGSWHYCEQCPFKTNSYRHLKDHILYKHTRKHDSPEHIKWFKCELCKYRAKNESNLKRHIEKKHADSRDIELFHCDLCPFKSKSRTTLKFHTKDMHTDSKSIGWFHCDKCPYKTKRRYTLKQHMLDMHIDPKDIVWLKCNLCDYKGKRKWDLRAHVKRMHSKTPLFEFVKVCEN